MDLNNEFYFIYNLIGPPFIKSLIHYFPHFPKELNIVVITNTPELFAGIETDFNLIVVNLDSLREDWSIEHEKFIIEYDENSYFEKLIQSQKDGYQFPMSTMRYGIKWAYQNNITKFALVDLGCKVMELDLFKNALNDYKYYAESNNGSALIGPIQTPQNVNYDFGKETIASDYRIYEILKENNIDVEKILNTESIYKFEDNQLYGGVGFDGFFYGVYFNDVNLVKNLYKIYDELMRFSYQNNVLLTGGHTVYPFEWTAIIINSAFSRTYDTILVGYRAIVRHEYMPELMYYDIHNKFGSDWGFVNANSRKEFLILNRERLIQHYGSLERAKMVVYDFE